MNVGNNLFISTSKFWLNNPKVLLDNLKIIPKADMNIDDQMNCLTRLVILIFLILFLFGYQQSLLFLILSIIFIIILYYIKNNKMITENYTSPFNKMTNGYKNYENNKNTLSIINSVQNKENEYKNLQKKYTSRMMDSTSFYKQQSNNYKAGTNQNFYSVNQKLTGNANPKTKIAPVLVAPSHDLPYWKNSDFSVRSNINSRSIQDFYSSGYSSVNDNSCIEEPTDSQSRSKSNLVENFIQGQYESTSQKGFSGQEGKYENLDNNIYQKQKNSGDFPEYDMSNLNEYGNVITVNGYDENNLNYDLPVNYSPTECQENDDVKMLNEEIFTSIITPDTYYKTDVIEPISSNIGISFTQQIPGRIKTKNGLETLYTASNKYNSDMDPENKSIPNNQFISTYDVYDPRYNGYGTSYRSYVDTMTGQPRFYYDDVDAIRRPNYISRSKVDHIPENITYGPVVSKEEFYDNNKKSRNIADDAFTDQTIQFRTEMMTRLLRKQNANAWQQKLAPIGAKQQSSMGGRSFGTAPSRGTTSIYHG